MRRKVDLENWVRKAHFEFFNAFEEPYYGVCVNVDCTAAYSLAKRNGFSFFLYYLHRSLSAAQMVEPFRYRTEQGEVFIYDRIDAGSAIDRINGTFGYGHILYHEDLDQSLEDAKREVERVRNSSDLTRTTAGNVIRYSPLPWIDFTSLSHARIDLPILIQNSPIRVLLGGVLIPHHRDVHRRQDIRLMASGDHLSQ